jgi:hypothetical protein
MQPLPCEYLYIWGKFIFLFYQCTLLLFWVGNEKMRKYLTMYRVYEEAVSHIWLCNRSLLNFLIYEENFLSSFLSVHTAPIFGWIYLSSAEVECEASEAWDRWSRCGNMACKHQQQISPTENDTDILYWFVDHLFGSCRTINDFIRVWIREMHCN